MGDLCLILGSPCPNCGDIGIRIAPSENICVFLEMLNEAINDEFEEKYDSAFGKAYNSIELTLKEIHNRFGNFFGSLPNDAPDQINNFPDNWQKVQNISHQKSHGYSIDKTDVQIGIDVAKTAIESYLWENNRHCVKT